MATYIKSRVRSVDLTRHHPVATKRPFFLPYTLFQVKDLFKSQRDKRSEAKPSPPSPHDGGDGGSNPADDSAQAAGATISSLDARAMAIEGALKSALRFACDVTSKV